MRHEHVRSKCDSFFWFYLAIQFRKKTIQPTIWLDYKRYSNPQKIQEWQPTCLFCILSPSLSTPCTCTFRVIQVRPRLGLTLTCLWCLIGHSINASWYSRSTSLPLPVILTLLFVSCIWLIWDMNMLEAKCDSFVKFHLTIQFRKKNIWPTIWLDYNRYSDPQKIQGVTTYLQFASCIWLIWDNEPGVANLQLVSQMWLFAWFDVAHMRHEHVKIKYGSSMLKNMLPLWPNVRHHQTL